MFSVSNANDSSIFIQEFDFNELEKATEYDGGYTEKSQIIIDFWNIVHSLPLETKKKLLEFTTGKAHFRMNDISIGAK